MGKARESDQPQPKGFERVWRHWIRPLLFVLVVLGVFRSSVADWNDVPTGSMEPTIAVGDRIAINKLAYDLKIPFTTWRVFQWGDPQRGDIVVFFEPNSKMRMVKRVIGVPGDEVELRYNQLYINGSPVNYQWPQTFLSTVVGQEHLPNNRSHKLQVVPRRPNMATFGPVTVPEGEFMMMGDNRDNSRDSRAFGFIPRDAIIGEAFGVAMSFDLTESYRPRWERFFSDLD